MDFSRDPQLFPVAEAVAKSVQVILDPSSSASDRAQAQAYYDSVQQTRGPADICTLGFMLISSGIVSSPVIHSGLQFIHNIVHYHWSELTVEQRVSIKEMFLMNVRSNGSLFNTPYLQESLAKGIVEIAKKEWPQLWPDFFDKMLKLTETSNVPLLVLRRLVEDVYSLDTIDSHERKMDLMQSLNLTANELIEVLFSLQQVSVKQCLVTNNAELIHRVKIILSVISSYFEWVNTSVILAGGRISSLINLIQLKQFQLQAIECLHQVMERKGTKKEAEVPKEFLQTSSCESIIISIAGCGVTESDEQYLHKLGDVLMLLGSTVQNPSNDEVSNFTRCILVLSNHGDLKSLGLAAAAFHNLIKIMERLPEATRPELPAIQELISILIRKFLTPPKMSSRVEMIVLKQNLICLLKAACRLNPNFYLFVSQWYYECLQSVVTVPAYQWDVLAFILDAVASSVSSDSEDIVRAGLNDLKTSLNRFNAEVDSLIKSSHLSIVSSLFVFLNLIKLQNNFGEDHLFLMEGILTSAFAQFTPGEISDAQIALRTHVASFLIKLATKFPELLTVSFNTLSNLAASTTQSMRHIEIQFTMECFFIISNTWKDYDRQKQLVERAITPDTWLEMERMLSSPESFRNIFQETSFLQWKSLISNNLHMLYAALRRIQNIVAGPNQERMHAAFDASCVTLPIVIQYVKMMYYVLEAPQFQSVVELTESEKSQVLGIVHVPGAQLAQHSTVNSGVDVNDATDYRSTVTKFIRTTVEMSYGILGLSCILFTPKLYSIPLVQDSFLNAVGWKMRILPDYRVRNIVHSVYRPFLHCCPATSQQTVLFPFLKEFTPFMFERLTQRWAHVQQASGATANTDGDEENEILETATLRILTRDYIDTIYGVLEGVAQKKDFLKQLNGLIGTNDMDVDMKEEDDMNGGIAEKTRSQNSITLCEFGANLLKDPVCFQSIIHLCGMALCWNDSGVNYRAGRCLIICWDQIALQIDVVLGVLMNSLLSICTWVENEANKEILSRLIDLIHKAFHKQDPRINQMILEWGGTEDDLKKLSGAGSEGQKNDKKRRDVIRRMVRNNPNLESKKLQKSSWLEGMPKLICQKGKKESATDITDCFALAGTLIP